MPTITPTAAERQVLNAIYAERFNRCLAEQNAQAPEGCAQLAADQTEAAMAEYRRRFTKRTLLGAFLAMFVAGCSLTPTSVRSELEHVSHPLAGQPFGPNTEEDALNQANVVARWQTGRVYVEHGLGWNLSGRHGSGFYGPELTYSGRIGVELWSRK